MTILVLDLQQRYFKRRNSLDLAAAKKAEKELSVLLEPYRPKPSPEPQKSLF